MPSQPKPTVPPTILAELERLNSELVEARMLIGEAAEYIQGRNAWLVWFASNLSHDVADGIVSGKPAEIVGKLRAEAQKVGPHATRG